MTGRLLPCQFSLAFSKNIIPLQGFALKCFIIGFLTDVTSVGLGLWYLCPGQSCVILFLRLFIFGEREREGVS